MSTAPQIHEQANGATSASGLPPVLTRVPWLAAQSAPAAEELPAVSRPAAFDATFFAPHQLLAAADSEVSLWRGERQHLRIDGAQPLGTAANTAPAAIALKPPLAPPATARPALEPLAPKTTPVTAPGGSGITHLRFDPPVESTSAKPAEPAAPATPTPSMWHEWVTAFDNAIRQYHRVIMLAALLTAAGLMMLVLEHQRPEGETTPESTSPAAIDSSTVTAVPLARSAGEPPAEPERIAMAQGPGSHAHREATTPITPEEPQSIPLEPIAAHEESPAENSLAESPTAQWPIILPEQPECQSQASGYPTTGCQPLPWPTSTADTAGQTPLNRARLSRDIQPPNQQIK